MKITIYMGMSLDGFLARPDDGLDFLPAPPDGDDMGFGAFLASVDTLVMGRRTFEVVHRFGPEGWVYGDTPMVVLSRTWTTLPDDVRPSVRLRAASPAELAAELAAAGVRHVYVDGADVARSFLRAGLVTDLCVTFVPVLIGQGISLWGELPHDIQLELTDSRVQPGGMVQSWYRVR